MDACMSELSSLLSAVSGFLNNAELPIKQNV